MEKKQYDLHGLPISNDKKLKRLLHHVVTEVNAYAQDQLKHIRKLSEIGIALSAESNIDKLFEMIVDEARSFCQAEAGTLYILNKSKETLEFKVLQNELMNIRTGGENGGSLQMTDVPLFVKGKPNYSNVSSYVAHTGKPINLPDIYEMSDVQVGKGLDFSGTMAYDRTTGYRTRSMLVVPMTNHEKDIIGVLQLINARDEDTRQVVSFSVEYEDIVLSLASQAAIALTNNQLVKELKELFYSFIESIATAIDEKSAYTGGHIRRVVKLAMMIAQDINNATGGVYKDVNFNDAEMEELYIAAWMHDVGKITTPEYIVDKATRLETIVDRLIVIETRFQLIKQIIENHYQGKKLELMASQNYSINAIEHLDKQCHREIKQIDDDFEFVKLCNNSSTFMTDDNVGRVRGMGRKTYTIDGKKLPYLTENEVYNLSIRKGTLTDEERKIIEHHAQMTFNITRQLSFPKDLSNVPEYASSHHEKMDCSGYPRGLCGDQLPLQARIIAVADIFEALTAKDRPYKKDMRLSKALKILNFMKEDNHLDGDLLDLFSENKIYLKYAEIEMDSEQIDTQ